jgi:uncharacterized membrane protein YphA (DoxX/SURF4 family)
MTIKYIINNSIRIFTGILFIFSGLVKLNDPVGTQIKMEEYFEVFAGDFGSFFLSLIPYALEFGMVMLILEVVLGIALLINYKVSLAIKALLVMIVYFTFLTFYSAYFNKVTDCGCFGDAIPLTPWQSFYKDIILTVFIIYLYINRNSFKPLFGLKAGNMVIASSTVICLIIGVYAVQHLPYIDFRYYRIGDNINENMQPEEQPVFEYTFVKNGETIKSQKYLLESDGYVLEGYEIVNADKTTPKITDYNVWNPDVGDYTAYTFEGIKLLVIIVDVEKAKTKKMNDISKLLEETNGKIEAIALTSSDPSIFEPFRHEHQLSIPYFFSDATVLKAMIRSNPGTMLLKDGTVMGKWHYNDTPDIGGILEALE